MEQMDLVRLKSGDQQAFEQLVRTYEKQVYHVAMRMLGDADTAADATQDIFLKIYRSVASFKEESKISTWIYRISVNVCIDYQRSRSRKQESPLNYIDEEGEQVERELPDERYTPEDKYAKAERLAALKEAIASLTEDHRAVLILRDIQGLPYEQIAVILNCSEGTMKSRLNRAREALRKKLLCCGNLFETYQSNQAKEVRQ